MAMDPNDDAKLPTKHWPSAPAARNLPAAVLDACERFAARHGLPAGSVLAVLQHDGLNGCYCFWYAGMFHGIELDGHIHT